MSPNKFALPDTEEQAQERTQEQEPKTETGSGFGASEPIAPPPSSGFGGSDPIVSTPAPSDVSVTPKLADTDAEIMASMADAKARHEAAIEAEAEAALLKEQGRQAREAAARAVVHTVASGDSLWGIAAEYLKDGSRWREIYEANKDVIGDNPNLIQVGQKLTIPTVQL